MVPNASLHLMTEIMVHAAAQARLLVILFQMWKIVCNLEIACKIVKYKFCIGPTN